MERSSKLTQRQIDELLAGRLPDGVEAPDELLATISRLREMSHQPISEGAREAHLLAVFEALPVSAQIQATEVAGRTGGPLWSVRANVRGKMKKLIPILKAKVAAVLIVVLGGGVAMAAGYDELPPEVQSAVDSVVATLGLSSVDDIEVTEFEVEDGGASVEFEGNLPGGGEVEYESDACETEIEVEQSSTDGSETETEISQSTGIEDCDDDELNEDLEDDEVDEVDDDECEIDDDEIDDDEIDDDECESTVVTVADEDELDDEDDDGDDDEDDEDDEDDDDEDDQDDEDDDEEDD